MVLIGPLQVVAVTADWLVVTANEISVTKYISKEWTALILLPTVRAVAGMLVESKVVLNLDISQPRLCDGRQCLGQGSIDSEQRRCYWFHHRKCRLLLQRGSTITPNASIATLALRYSTHLHRRVDNWVSVGDAL